MGCDIHAFAEYQTREGKWRSQHESIFNLRDYNIFAWLAGVRNYSGIEPLSAPRGVPEDAAPITRGHYDEWEGDAHTPSWFTLDELLAVDFSQQIEDRRCMRQTGPNSWNGGATCNPGEGVRQTLQQFLGQPFIDELKKIKANGAQRIVFWFDN